MFVALWEFEVKPGSEERFEKAYGPDGDWVRLFQGETHYYETRLARDSFRPGVYLTLDFWEWRAAYGEFMAGHPPAYDAVEAGGGGVAPGEAGVGRFGEV